YCAVSCTSSVPSGCRGWIPVDASDISVCVNFADPSCEKAVHVASGLAAIAGCGRVIVLDVVINNRAGPKSELLHCAFGTLRGRVCLRLSLSVGSAGCANTACPI